MNAKEKYDALVSIFEQHRNQINAEAMAAYMKHHFSFFGIGSKQRKTLEKEVFKEDKATGNIDWEFLHQCFDHPHREMQYAVSDYLLMMQKYLRYEDIEKIEYFVRNKQWWDSIDAFDTIIGDIGLKDERVDQVMLRWSSDENIWMRRIAIDHQLNRKDKTNKELLGKIIENNLGSDEFFINKAIGWSLREYSKTDPVWVKHFIDLHKDNMAKLSVKEASKYIS